MDATLIIAALVLVGCALLLVFYPLWQNSSTNTVLDSKTAGLTQDELHVRYQTQLSIIKELMFDQEMGKVTPEEVEPLLNNAKVKAANIRREIDQLATNTTLDTELEALISQTRLTLANLNKENEPLLQSIDTEIAKLKNGTSSTLQPQLSLACPQCNITVNIDHEFCSGCGHKLEWKKETICHQCGYIYDNTDTYCARCGVLLKIDVDNLNPVES